MSALKQFTTRLRKALPAPLRQVLRAGRLATRPGKVSPRIPQELLSDCRFFANRFEMLKGLPTGGTIAEIGTDKGLFASHILKTNAPSRLHLFDLDFRTLDEAVRSDARVSLHEGATPGTLAVLPDGGVDWIYVDGDHSYAGVVADAAAAATKVRPGGYLVFNDFAHADPFLGQYGVHRAVMEFVSAQRWPIVMFAYHPSALYDVALRRPD